MKKIFKTDIGKYNTNDPYERYLLKVSIAKDMCNYTRELALKNSQQTLDKVKKLVKKAQEENK